MRSSSTGSPARATHVGSGIGLLDGRFRRYLESAVDHKVVCASQLLGAILSRRLRQQQLFERLERIRRFGTYRTLIERRFQ